MRTVLRRLKLGQMVDTLPERLVLARQRKMPYQDFLGLILSDEGTRRDQAAAHQRARLARLDPAMVLDAWDDSTTVTYDQQLWSELCTLRFRKTRRAS